MATELLSNKTKNEVIAPKIVDRNGIHEKIKNTNPDIIIKKESGITKRLTSQK